VPFGPVSDILSVISQKVTRSRDPEHILFRMHALVLFDSKLDT